MRRPTTLALAMRDSMVALLLESDAEGMIALDGSQFSDVGLGSWVGFFDWLRTDTGKLVGVRSWLSESQFADIRQQLSMNRAVELRKASVLIWFESVRVFAENRSNDQSLADHRIMRDSNGTTMLTFSVEDLSDAELESLRRAITPYARGNHLN